MSKFIVKTVMTLSFLIICQIFMQILSPAPALAETSSLNILSSVAAAAEKRQAAEKQAAPAVPEKKSRPDDFRKVDVSAEKKVQEEEQSIMEDALLLLEESESYWKKGELEDALDLLDRAYALIIETNDDPLIARQKDDLRLLISKRILAIYSSRQTVTSGKRSEIPLVMNADVEKEIRSFQSFERDFFISSYHRSGAHRPMIVKELKKAGLPEELSWLPLVESGFKVLALSKARALGPWQFIPSTGYKYGLNREEWVDERMDPVKSTRAAIGYLKDLHNMFGDWLTVLAAYNCGEGRVLRVISGQHLNYLDRFWDLYHLLPYETARYVPRFLATLHIIRDPGKFGMDLGKPLENPVPYEEVKAKKIMRLRDIAAALDIPEETLNALNPELRHRMTPDREYLLKVPLETADKFMAVADGIQQGELPKQVRVAGKSSYKRHKVKRGETAPSIAHRYGISVSALLAYNGLSAKRGVRVGQQLKVPLRGVRYASDASGQRSGRDTGSGEQIIRYKVRSGDTLSSVAQRYNTTPSEIKKLNNISADTIRIGQTIRISCRAGASRSVASAEPQRVGKKAAHAAAGKTAGPETAGAVYRVRKGDSLDKIAKKSNVSLARILELNGLDTAQAIQPGQVIVVK
jgi:membrane-bound lytic murein transglycosylase D